MLKTQWITILNIAKNSVLILVFVLTLGISLVGLIRLFSSLKNKEDFSLNEPYRFHKNTLLVKYPKEVDFSLLQNSVELPSFTVPFQKKIERDSIVTTNKTPFEFHLSSSLLEKELDRLHSPHLSSKKDISPILFSVSKIQIDSSYAIYEIVGKKICFLGAMTLTRIKEDYLEFSSDHTLNSNLRAYARLSHQKLVLLIKENSKQENTIVKCFQWVGVRNAS